MTASRAPSTSNYDAVDYFPPSSARWNGWWFLLAQVPYFAIVVLSLLPLLPHSSESQPASAGLATFGYAFTLSMLVLASRRRGSGSLTRDYGWTIRPVDILLGAAATFGLLIVAVVAASLAHSFGGTQPESNVHLGPNHIWNAVSVFFIPVLVAAPIEEILFRGLLMRWIRNFVLRSGGPSPSTDRRRAAVYLSVAISAVAFALSHLYEAHDVSSALNIGLQTLALGLVAGYLDTKTGRLGPGVVAHGLHNAVVAISTLS